MKRIKIPRWLGYSDKYANSTTLHIFSDASKVAYAASLRIIGLSDWNGLGVTIMKDLELNGVKCYHWTDSTNALYWIKNEDQWGVYVWNRESEIRKSSDTNYWRHVPGNLNPADLPSRGCSAKKLIESSWWEGPDWLKSPESQSLSEIVIPDIDVLTSERKRVVVSN